MTEGHGPPPEGPRVRVEEHRVFALLAFPIFGVSILIIILIATLGTR